MSESSVDYLAMRTAMADSETSAVASLGPSPADVEEFYHKISLPSGHSTRVKVFRPKPAASATQSRPLIVLFHGGGFVAGSIEMQTRPARDFAQAHGAVVVSAGYRLAPEHLFLVSVQDAVDTTRWMAGHAGEALGADLKMGFFIGGGSAGPQAAAVAASEARQDLGKCAEAKCIIPLDPATAGSAGPTNPEMLKAVRDLAKVDVQSPLFSPFNCHLGLKGLPEAYVHLGGANPLRDDGLVFVEALKDAGGEVKCDKYDGLGHEGWTIWWIEEREPKSLIENTMKGMG